MCGPCSLYGVVEHELSRQQLKITAQTTERSIHRLRTIRIGKLKGHPFQAVELKREHEASLRSTALRIRFTALFARRQSMCQSTSLGHSGSKAYWPWHWLWWGFLATRAHDILSVEVSEGVRKGRWLDGQVFVPRTKSGPPAETKESRMPPMPVLLEGRLVPRAATRSVPSPNALANRAQEHPSEASNEGDASWCGGQVSDPFSSDMQNSARFLASSLTKH